VAARKCGGDLVTAYNKNLERHEQVVSKFKSDFQGELDKWKNKGSFFDVEITDDVVKDLQQFVDERNGMILADKDGNVDAKAYFKAVFAMRYLHKVAEAKQNKGARKATEELVCVSIKTLGVMLIARQLPILLQRTSVVLTLTLSFVRSLARKGWQENKKLGNNGWS